MPLVEVDMPEEEQGPFPEDDIGAGFLTSRKERGASAFRQQMVDALATAPEDQTIPDEYKDEVEAKRLQMQPPTEPVVTPETQGELQQFMADTEAPFAGQQLTAEPSTEIPARLRAAGMEDAAIEFERRQAQPQTSPLPDVRPATLSAVPEGETPAGAPFVDVGYQEQPDRFTRSAVGFAHGFLSSAGSLLRTPANILEALIPDTADVQQALQTTPLAAVANSLQEAGQAAARTAQTLNTPTPRQQDFFDKLAEGAGNMAAYWAPAIVTGGLTSLAGLAPRAATALGVGIATVQESFAEANETYENLKPLIGQDEAALRAGKTLAANMLLLGITNSMGIGGEASTPLRHVMASVIGEGVQEAVQYDIQRRQFWVPQDNPQAQSLLAHGWQQGEGIVYQPFDIKTASEAGIIGGILGGGMGFTQALALGTSGMREAVEQRIQQLEATELGQQFVESVVRSERGAIGREQPLPESAVRGEAGGLTKVYHGTTAAFEQFDPAMQGKGGGGDLYGQGYYFTESPEVAGGTGRQGAVDLGYASASPFSIGPEKIIGEFTTEKAAQDFITQQGKQETTRIYKSMASVTGKNFIVFEAMPNIEAPNVRPAYLDIRNPFRIDGPIALVELHAIQELASPDIEGLVRYAAETNPETGDDFYQALVDQFDGDKAAVNEVLKDAGYDGITHIGGSGENQHRVWIAFSPEQVIPAFSIDAALQAFRQPQPAQEQAQLQATEATPQTDQSTLQRWQGYLDNETGAISLGMPTIAGRPLFRTMTARRQAEEGQLEQPQPLPPESPQERQRRFTLRERAEGLPTARLRTESGAWRVPRSQIPPQELELQDFIRQQGGIKLEGETDVPGELRGLISPKETGTTGLLNNVRGLSLQDMAERANEHGFTPTADKTALLEALARSVNMNQAVMSRNATGYVPLVDNPALGMLLGRINDIGDRYEQIIQTERRGTMRVQQINDEAARMIEEGEITPSQIRAREPGEAVNPEIASAIVQVANDAFTALQDRARAFIDAGATEGSQEEQMFLELIGAFAGIDPKRFGAMAESGRTLRILGDPLSAINRTVNQMREGLQKAPDVNTRRFAQMILSYRSLAQMSRMIKAVESPTLGDMFLEAWINGLLSSPTTHMVNFMSNSLVAGWAIPERFLAEAFKDGAVPGEARALAFGYTHSLREGLRVFASSWREGEPLSGVSKLEIRPGAISAENMNIDPDSIFGLGIDALANYAIRLPGRSLMASDEFFKFLNYRAELYAQAYRKGYAQGIRGHRGLMEFAQQNIPEARAFEQAVRQGKERGFEGDDLDTFVAEQFQQFDPEIIRKAKDFSFYQTFQQELGPIGQAVQRLSNLRTPVGIGIEFDLPVGKILLPFVRTPANIFKFAFQRTPAALLLSQEVKADLKAGGERAALAKARMGLGTMVMSGVAGLALSGFVTGRGPEDNALRETLRRQGWQPYSLKVWNPQRNTWTYVAFNRLDPAGMLFGVVADIVQAYRDPDLSLVERTLAMTLLAFSRNFTSKTYMQGLAEALDAMSAKGFESSGEALSAVEKFGAGRLQSVVPRLLTTIERVQDPAKSSRVMTEIGDALNLIYSQIPGWSKNVPSDRNLWGEKILLGYGFSPKILAATYNAASPLYLRDAVESPIDKELERHQIKLTNPSKVWAETAPSTVEKDIDALYAEPVQLKRVKLNAKQYELFQLYASANHGELAALGAPPVPPQSLLRIKEKVQEAAKQPAPSLQMTLKETLDWLITTRAYDIASDGPLGGKEDMIRKVVNVFREEGKALTIEADQELFNKIMNARDFMGIQRTPEYLRPMERRRLMQERSKAELKRGLRIGQ